MWTHRWSRAMSWHQGKHFLWGRNPMIITCSQQSSDKPFLCFIPPHPGSPVPAQGPARASCSWSSHLPSGRCSCQEFLGAGRMCCWLRRHTMPRDAWEHMDLLPGGMGRPCQVPAELQACAMLCWAVGMQPDPKKQLLWSQAEDSLVEVAGMTDGRGGSLFFLDMLQPFHIFAISRIWSEISALKIRLNWVYIWVLSHLKSWSPFFISLSSSGCSLLLFLPFFHFQ